jgi:hypothetical protein
VFGRFRRMRDQPWLTYRGWSLTIVLALGAGSLAGCARWSNLSDEVKAPTRSLPSQLIPEDVAAVEAVFMRLGAEQLASLELVWPRVNEQALSLELRQQLDLNGIRAAVVDAVVPLALQQMLDSVERRLNEDPLELIGVAADIRSHSRFYQCRQGQRKEVMVGMPRKGSVVLLYNEQGNAKGRHYDEPQFLFDLRAFPKGDGSTMLSLTPEIQYGPLKQKFVSQEFALRREMKRDADRWEALRIEQNLQPGQMLMITASMPARGLGEELFFTETAHGTREPLLIMVRTGIHRLDSAFTAK